MKLILTGTVEQISTRQDQTIVVKFGTQEIDNDNAARLFQLRNKFCKLLLTDDNITNLESELVSIEPIATDKKNKTPGQRLRSTLYIVHEQMNITEDFDVFYKAEMEKIINHYKTKIT